MENAGYDQVIANQLQSDALRREVGGSEASRVRVLHVQVCEFEWQSKVHVHV